MTYSEASITEYISANFVPFKCTMGQREHLPMFRANHIIWTPSVGFGDHNGNMHYQSQGFLPPSEFLSALKIGKARCLMAWMRSAEAAHELELAAATENAFTPEALFWLSVAYYLERRDTTRMYEIWEQLTRRYPNSPWTKRTYPRPTT